MVNFILIFLEKSPDKRSNVGIAQKNKGVNRWLVKLLGLRLIITAEDSLWDQRFWKDLFLGGGCSLSGGLGLCKGDSCSGIKGPQFLECSSLLAPFCDSGVRMSGWSSASNITPWHSDPKLRILFGNCLGKTRHFFAIYKVCRYLWLIFENNFHGLDH